VKVLLDTHVLLWALADDPRLSKKARAILLDDAHTLLWSAASTWELAIKVALKRIHFAAPVAEYLPAKLESEGIESLSITTAHASAVESLPLHHHDPFDRLLIAQARIEDVALISADKIIKRYDLEVIW
jgi:PIN domain nuclease of toxin-antitoxin system